MSVPFDGRSQVGFCGGTGMALGHSIILTDIYVHSSTDMTSFAGPSHCRIDDMLHMSKLFRHSHDPYCQGHTNVPSHYHT